MHFTPGHLLLGLFPSQPVDLRGAFDVGDGRSQLDVFSVVSSGISCTRSPKLPQRSAEFHRHSQSFKRNSQRINQHYNTSSDASGKSPKVQTLLQSVMSQDGWFSLLPRPPRPPRPPPVPFSAWKEAWCPLKSQTRAKETLRSPGNLGPAESPQFKGKLRMNKRLRKHPGLASQAKMVHISLDLALLRLVSILI